MGIFFRRSRAANSAVRSRIWSNFELLRALMHVILTCKYEEERIETAEKKWQHRFSFQLLPYLLPCKPEIGYDQISNLSKLSCMSSSSASMKWIQSSTAEKKWRNRFSHYKSMGIFFRRSRAAYSAVGGRIWLSFELLQAHMHVIVTCKYLKDRIKTLEKK